MPTVLTPSETRSVLNELSGVHQMIAKLLYGSGLRLNEALQLRVKDIDFGYQQLGIRDAKGQENRVTILPEELIEPLRWQLETSKRQHQRDLERGYSTTRSF